MSKYYKGASLDQLATQTQEWSNHLYTDSSSFQNKTPDPSSKKTQLAENLSCPLQNIHLRSGWIFQLAMLSEKM